VAPAAAQRGRERRGARAAAASIQRRAVRRFMDDEVGPAKYYSSSSQGLLTRLLAVYPKKRVTRRITNDMGDNGSHVLLATSWHAN